MEGLRIHPKVSVLRHGVVSCSDMPMVDCEYQHIDQVAILNRAVNKAHRPIAKPLMERR